MRDGALVLLDKAAGLTSRQAGRRVADILQLPLGQALGRRGPKFGHLGTLDPFATGVLPIMLGEATKLASYLGVEPKRYSATVQLGATTSTDDPAGVVLERFAVPALDDAAVAAAALQFVGSISQTPPVYSAIRVASSNGKRRRAYAAARSGGKVEMAPRTVEVMSCSAWLARDADGRAASDRLELEVECGTGTFIRSIARDLAAALGTGGHLVSLRRERVGPWGIGDATTLEQLEARSQNLFRNNFKDHRGIPGRDLVPSRPCIPGVLGMRDALELCVPPSNVLEVGGESVRGICRGDDLGTLQELRALQELQVAGDGGGITTAGVDHPTRGERKRYALVRGDAEAVALVEQQEAGAPKGWVYVRNFAAA